MSIKLPPNSIVPASTWPQPSGSAQALSGMIMAPASLTPLAPPSTAGLAVPSARDRGSAAEGRQAFFAGHQKALLDRLERADAALGAGQGSALSSAQRAACVAVLKNIAIASAK